MTTPSGGEPPAEENDSLPAKLGEERLARPVVRTGMFGAVAQALGAALTAEGSGFGEAVERVVVDRGELPFHVRREHLLAVADKMLHDPALRFEIFSGVSGVHYPDEVGRELRAVYHLASITHNRRVRLEVSTPDSDRHVPSVTSVYPAANS